MRYILYIAVFLSIAQLTFAQKNVSFALQNAINSKHSAEKSYDLLIKGNLRNLETTLRSDNIKIKYISGEWIAIHLMADQLEKLIQYNEIEELFFDTSKGFLLNDLMLSNANVIALQEIGIYDSLLTGKDVIIGFIDSGVDYSHPDFINEDGSTRLLYFWDQKNPPDSTQIFEDYGYGKLINQDTINNWLDSSYQVIMDPNNWYGHGTTVVGTACSNGNALADMLESAAIETDFHGVAPNSSIIMVASDFDRPNWLASIADGVHFMLAKAEEEAKPIVINLSVGTYSGSHDALDPVGLLINDWFNDEHSGRTLVCAGGNSRSLRYHLGYHSTLDTSFSLYSSFNGPSEYGRMAFMELWLDSMDIDGCINTVAVYDMENDEFYFPTINYRNVYANIDTTFIDTIFLSDTNAIGIVKRYSQMRGDQIQFQVLVEQLIDNSYKVGLFTSGESYIDTWSASWLGSSDILGPESLPFSISNSDYYISPDSLMQTVSSFSCAENVITVSNYKNRVSYTDINNTVQNLGGQAGELAEHSSRGPTRDNRQKPDLSASGELVLSSGPYNYVEILLNAAPFKLAQGGWHMRNGGSSMASPIVAGIAALYLQRCPFANPSDVKEAILASAYQDIFTGIVPNPSWGFGKVDGLASLDHSIHDIEISENTSMCEGAMVGLYIENDYSSIQWNTGDSSSSICVEPGNYWVEAIDDKGCIQKSMTYQVLANDIVDDTRSELKVFPNPFKNTFQVYGFEQKPQFIIVNALGQKQAFKIIESDQSWSIEMIDAQSGIYFLYDKISHQQIELIRSD